MVYRERERVLELTDAHAPGSTGRYNGEPANAPGNAKRLLLDAAGRARRIETELTRDDLCRTFQA